MPEPAGDGTVGAAAGVEIGPAVLLDAVPSARFSLAGGGVRRPGKGLTSWTTPRHSSKSSSQASPDFPVSGVDGGLPVFINQ